MGLPHPCLMLVTEPCGALAVIVEQGIDGGVDAVLWHDGRAKIGKRDAVLAGVASAAGERALLIADGNWETFVRLGLRRIHLPERSVPVGVVKFRIGNGALVGKSVGTVAAAVQAEVSGADYLLVDHVFHPEGEAFPVASGLTLLREVCAAVRVSVVAMGGITPGNTADCLQAGAAGVAVSSEILYASDPLSSARSYRVSLDAAWR